MNVGTTLATKRRRFVTLVIAFGLALTLFVGQHGWGQLIGVVPAVAYACQGPGGNC